MNKIMILTAIKKLLSGFQNNTLTVKRTSTSIENEKLGQLINEDHIVFGLTLNMNDTFGYACGESGEIDSYDLKYVFPLYLNYGRSAFIAYESVKRGYDPITPRITQKFKEAKEKILELKKSHKYFMGDYK